MMPGFMLNALLAGMALALLAGPLGSIVVWRRLAYFGETLAHSAMLGFALALALSLPSSVGVMLCSLVMAVLLVSLQRRSQMASDTVLGILSHGSLALGLVLISLLPVTGLNIESLLFGDLLAVSQTDVLMIGLVTVVSLPLLWWGWNGLVAWAVQEELAAVEGRPVRRIEQLFMVLMALVIAVGMKVVGVILITAMLIIPAATARRLASSPEAMALAASALAIIAVGLGLALSFYLDTPAGPAVVVASTGLFGVSLLLPRRLA